MSHQLYQRIESIVRQISPQVTIFDKASSLSSKRGIKIGTNGDTSSPNNTVPKYQPITCNPNLRLYKYSKGQWFGRHVDDSNKIDFQSFGSCSGNLPFSASDVVREPQTELTVLFYLSSCRGGATRFHLPHGTNGGSSGGVKGKKGGSGDGSVAFTPEEGAVLLHAHGDHCLEHEAEPVLEGLKYGKRDIFSSVLSRQRVR